jgi:hypothetical protein
MIEVWLDDARGNRLAHLDKLESLELIHVLNDYGVIGIELPSDYDGYINLDGIIEVWYNGRMEAAGWIRKMVMYDDSNGEAHTRLIAYTGNYVLTSRIVAYAAGSAQASMTDQADDMLKEIANDNLLGDATGARDLYSTLGLTKAANEADGQSITKSFAWRTLLYVCQDIAYASRAAGTAVYFDWLPKMVSANVMSWEFRTWINQRGIDHGTDSGQPVYFGKAWGNLAGPSLEYDHTDEVNYVYAGGQGEGSDRNINEVSDTTRIGASVWNRREGFADARNESADDGVTAKGYEALNNGRPRVVFSGEITESPSTLYGVHWDFGDKVIVEYRGVEYDAIVMSARLALTSDGSLKITGKFEADASSGGQGFGLS